jgi:rRNA maturation endonuclease Nob1
MPQEVDIVHEAGLGRRLVCPECGHLLPVDNYTECDRCGAHIELQAVVHAPAIDE